MTTRLVHRWKRRAHKTQSFQCIQSIFMMMMQEDALQLIRWSWRLVAISTYGRYFCRKLIHLLFPRGAPFRSTRLAAHGVEAIFLLICWFLKRGVVATRRPPNSLVNRATFLISFNIDEEIISTWCLETTTQHRGVHFTTFHRGRCLADTQPVTNVIHPLLSRVVSASNLTMVIHFSRNYDSWQLGKYVYKKLLTSKKCGTLLSSGSSGRSLNLYSFPCLWTISECSWPIIRGHITSLTCTMSKFTSTWFLSYFFRTWPTSCTTFIFPSAHCPWEILLTNKYKTHLCSAFCNIHWPHHVRCSSDSTWYTMPSCLHLPRTSTPADMTSLTTFLSTVTFSWRLFDFASSI